MSSAGNTSYSQYHAESNENDNSNIPRLPSGKYSGVKPTEGHENQTGFGFIGTGSTPIVSNSSKMKSLIRTPTRSPVESPLGGLDMRTQSKMFGGIEPEKLMTQRSQGGEDPFEFLQSQHSIQSQTPSSSQYPSTFVSPQDNLPRRLTPRGQRTPQDATNTGNTVSAIQNERGAWVIPPFSGRVDAKMCIEGQRTQTNVISEQLTSAIQRMDDVLENAVRKQLYNSHQIQQGRDDDKEYTVRQQSLVSDRLRAEFESKQCIKQSEMTNMSAKKDSIIMELSQRVMDLSMRQDSYESSMENMKREMTYLKIQNSSSNASMPNPSNVDKAYVDNIFSNIQGELSALDSKADGRISVWSDKLGTLDNRMTHIESKVEEHIDTSDKNCTNMNNTIMNQSSIIDTLKERTEYNNSNTLNNDDNSNHSLTDEQLTYINTLQTSNEALLHTLTEKNKIKEKSTRVIEDRVLRVEQETLTNTQLCNERYQQYVQYTQEQQQQIHAVSNGLEHINNRCVQNETITNMANVALFGSTDTLIINKQQEQYLRADGLEVPIEQEQEAVAKSTRRGGAQKKTHSQVPIHIPNVLQRVYAIEQYTKQYDGQKMANKDIELKYTELFTQIEILKQDLLSQNGQNQQQGERLTTLLDNNMSTTPVTRVDITVVPENEDIPLNIDTNPVIVELKHTISQVQDTILSDMKSVNTKYDAVQSEMNQVRENRQLYDNLHCKVDHLHTLLANLESLIQDIPTTSGANAQIYQLLTPCSQKNEGNDATTTTYITNTEDSVNNSADNDDANGHTDNKNENMDNKQENLNITTATQKDVPKVFIFSPGKRSKNDKNDSPIFNLITIERDNDEEGIHADKEDNAIMDSKRRRVAPVFSPEKLTKLLSPDNVSPSKQLLETFDNSGSEEQDWFE